MLCEPGSVLFFGGCQSVAVLLLDYPGTLYLFSALAMPCLAKLIQAPAIFIQNDNKITSGLSVQWSRSRVRSLLRSVTGS